MADSLALRSPFKFLDAYQEQDKDIFFGRETEIGGLYQAVNATKLLLVYGASGTGKSSLIECGLRNRFSRLDWEAVTIRRNAYLPAAAFETINQRLPEKRRIPLLPNADGHLLPEDPETTLSTAVKALYQAAFKPIYLLFDQFEELLILGSEDEQQRFFADLQTLLETKTPCRVLLVMREEFIGHLSEFEKLVPALFRSRFRVERMSRPQVQEVIQKTLTASQFAPAFTVTEADASALSEAVLKILPDDRREIELAHLQVYLDKLWKRGKERVAPDAVPALSPVLVAENDKLETILADFLREQVQALQPDTRQLPWEVLNELISSEATKLQRTEHELWQALTAKDIALTAPELKTLLAAFEQNRIVRTLKTGDIVRYELSHDLLAKIVKRDLAQEIQRREEARKEYHRHLTSLKSDPTFQLSQFQLNELAPHEKNLPYPPDLQALVTRSQEAIEAQKRKERRRNQLIAGFGVIATLAAVVAVVLFFNAQTAKSEAQQAAQQAKQERNKAVDAKQQAEQEKTRADSAKDAAQSALLRMYETQQSDLERKKRAFDKAGNTALIKQAQDSLIRLESRIKTLKKTPQ